MSTPTEAVVASRPDMRQLTFTRFIAAMSVVVYHWSLHTPALKAAIAAHTTHAVGDLVGDDRTGVPAAHRRTPGRLR